MPADPDQHGLDPDQHGHTPPEPDAEVADGVGTMIAEWTIAAMQGVDLDPNSLPRDEARALRRVQLAVAALRAERPDEPSDEPSA